MYLLKQKYPTTRKCHHMSLRSYIASAPSPESMYSISSQSPEFQHNHTHTNNHDSRTTIPLAYEGVAIFHKTSKPNCLLRAARELSRYPISHPNHAPLARYPARADSTENYFPENHFPGLTLRRARADSTSSSVDKFLEQGVPNEEKEISGHNFPRLETKSPGTRESANVGEEGDGFNRQQPAMDTTDILPQQPAMWDHNHTTPTTCDEHHRHTSIPTTCDVGPPPMSGRGEVGGGGRVDKFLELDKFLEQGVPKQTRESNKPRIR